jgi:hypothetical protein
LRSLGVEFQLFVGIVNKHTGVLQSFQSLEIRNHYMLLRGTYEKIMTNNVLEVYNEKCSSEMFTSVLDWQSVQL